MTNQPSWSPVEPQLGPTTVSTPPAEAPYGYPPPHSPSQVIATAGPSAGPGYAAQPTFGYANPYPYPVQVPLRNNGLAIASMILGIVGLMVFWFTFGIPSILAVVFGHVSLHQIRHGSHMGGRGMGIAGLVVGYVGLAGGLLFFLTLIGLSAVGV